MKELTKEKGQTTAFVTLKRGVFQVVYQGPSLDCTRIQMQEAAVIDGVWVGSSCRTSKVLILIFFIGCYLKYEKILLNPAPNETDRADKSLFHASVFWCVGTSGKW